MSDFQIKGADQLYKLSKSLTQAGEFGLKKDLAVQIRLATVPLRAATREVALSELPKKGGLNKRVAKAPQKIQIRTGFNTVGVRMIAGKRRSGARGADQGLIRHPIFFRPPLKIRWVDQKVPSGWFTSTLRKSTPAVLPFIKKALNDTAKRIERRH